MNSRVSNFFIHFLCWLGFLYLPVLLSPRFSVAEGFWNSQAPRLILANMLMIAVFYFNLKWLAPRFFLTKKYLIYILSALFCLGVVLGFHHLFMKPKQPTGIEQIQRPPMDVDRFPPPTMQGPEGPPPPENRRRPFNQQNNGLPITIGYSVFMFLLSFMVSLMLAVYQRWKDAEQQKVSSELSYLKAQINPHFLFNTLNSIYSLAVKKSDDTPTAIVKLSGMMRYAITEAHADKVSLNKEINYINNYIALQQLRLGNTLELNYQINGTVDTQQIVPMLLITFIENAFKYGVNAEENAAINIVINFTAEKLSMQVFNKKVVTSTTNDTAGGIGLDNTKRRLDLLYPGAHQLEIRETDNEFNVYLELNLI